MGLLLNCKLLRTAFLASLLTGGFCWVSTPAQAQPDEPEAAPADEPEELPEPEPIDETAPADEPIPEELPPEVGAPEPSRLTVHIITTRRTYSRTAFDVFDTSNEALVAEGVGADEGAGEEPATFELPAGTYKIVPRGRAYSSTKDFATVKVDGPTDFVIVVDDSSGGFRGSGIVSGELPEGRSLAGIRVSLNVGGSLMFNQSFNYAGTTNGENADLGLFGNFSLVYDRGDHFLKVDSKLTLDLRDPKTAAAFSTTDFFEGSALYAYNINNPWVGPYVRAGFKTRVYPGYLYLRDNGDTGLVNVHRLDGSTETYEFGGLANPDDLRIEIAEAFAPLTLQEEIGGNLKAVDLDLRLLKLNVATRIGYGFREGITNGLLVADGTEEGSPIELFEVDDYWTHGPLVGATATVTFARWLFGSGEAGVMIPLRDRDRAGDSFAERLLLDLSATGGFRFPALSFLHASLDYTLRLQRDGYITSDTQLAHSLMARANLQIF